MVRDDHKLLAAYGIVGIFFVWLALAATRQTYRAVEALRDFLPLWFPFANLVAFPLIPLLGGGAWRIPPFVRAFLYLLWLCSGSALYLSYENYPLAALAVVVLSYIEVYWVIPKLNARIRGVELRLEVPESRNLKSRIVEYLAYVMIALGVAGWLVYGVVFRPS